MLKRLHQGSIFAGFTGTFSCQRFFPRPQRKSSSTSPVQNVTRGLGMTLVGKVEISWGEPRAAWAHKPLSNQQLRLWITWYSVLKWPAHAKCNPQPSRLKCSTVTSRIVQLRGFESLRPRLQCSFSCRMPFTCLESPALEVLWKVIFGRMAEHGSNITGKHGPNMGPTWAQRGPNVGPRRTTEVWGPAKSVI